MAEITGAGSDEIPTPSTAELVGKPSTFAAESSDESPPRTSKPGTKRLLLTTSVLIYFLLGLPFLLKSAEIHRSPLPSDSIAALSRRLRSHPPSIHCSFHAVFLRSDPNPSAADQLELSISAELQQRRSGATDFAVSVTVDSGAVAGCARSRNAASGNAPTWRCGAVGPADLARGDVVVDELLNSVLRDEGVRVYTVVVVEREEEHGGGLRVVVGKHRHAWIVGKIDEEKAVSVIGNIFVNYFMNGGIEDGEGGIGKGEFMPVGSDGNVVLSFSLLNSEPGDWVYDWEFEKMGETMLAPAVEALRPIADMSIESQVLYHTPKSSHSYSDDKLRANIVSMGDIPFFVNSNEWHLDTSISATGRSKILQFVVYVPSAKECPLYLHLPDGEASKTNAFISPMWGGVVIWNPPNCSVDSQRTHVRRNTMSSQELKKMLEIFIAQLRLLFGLKPNYIAHDEDGVPKFIVSEKGFAEWELDLLFRHHASFNLLSSLTTQESLSSLVQSLPRMIVMDEIGKQVKLSLEAANLAQRNASLGISDLSAVSAMRARALAEDAFFHPSIMSISYASIEHYFAIYMPFFAPVCLHVLLAAIKELKRYKVERAKYLAFLAGQAKAS